MRQPAFAPAVSSCQTTSRYTLFAPLFPKSTPNMFNSLHRLRHCQSVVITLQWVMTRSSITHLIVHTSCASRPVSILPPARYHLLPPRIPQLVVRWPSPFFHPDLDPSVSVSTCTQTIHPFSISVHTSPAVRPQPPAPPAILHTRPPPSTARHNTLQQRGTPHRTQRQKTRRRSFSQLPEQLKWPGRVCAEQRRGE